MASLGLVLTPEQPALHPQGTPSVLTEGQTPGPGINVSCHHSAQTPAAAHLTKRMCPKEHVFYKGPARGQNSGEADGVWRDTCL